MKLAELIATYPWVSHPIVRAYAACFNEKQWALMAKAGLADAISSQRISDTGLIELLEENQASGADFFAALESGQTFAEYAEEGAAESCNISYLLSQGLAKDVLDNFFMTCRPRFANEYVSEIAAIYRALSSAERKEKINAYWQIDPFQFYQIKPLPAGPKDPAAFIEHLRAGKLDHIFRDAPPAPGFFAASADASRADSAKAFYLAQATFFEEALTKATAPALSMGAVN